MMDLGVDSTITLGGREFEPTPEDEIVFEQYAYLTRAAQEAGLGQELMEAYKPFVEELQGGAELNEEQLAQISEKVIMRAFEGRAYLKVLSGSLVEVGTEWTEENARANEDFFRRLKGEDIRKMHAVLTMATIGFFTSGLNSMTTSQSSSNQERQERLRAAGIDPAKVRMSPKRDLSPVGAIGMENSEKQ